MYVFTGLTPRQPSAWHDADPRDTREDMEPSGSAADSISIQREDRGLRAERTALIASLELEARNDPAGYRRRVAALAALGYVYIGLVALIAVSGTAALGWVLLQARLPGLSGVVAQLLWAVFLFAIVLLRSLWVRFPEPSGVPLDPGSYPTLSCVLDEVRASMRAPRIHRCLLTGDLGASVAQVPRLGLFGWPRNYLLLGLPLLDALTVDELRAVLAHEMGHLSGAHGRLGGWIYRTRAAWARVLDVMRHERHPGAGVLMRFFAWYVPRFDAYSFVAARAQERAADEWGARAGGSRALADALVRLPVLVDALEDTYWPPLYRRAVSSPEPVGSPHTEMVPALQAAVSSKAAQASLELAMAHPTTEYDTHPCLRDRLEALGEGPRLPTPADPPASAALLGAARAGLAARLDAAWADAVRADWHDRFESLQRGTKRLARVDAEGGPPVENAKRALELALLREDLQGAEAALPYLRAALEAHPSDAEIRFSLARILLESDREEGLEVLKPLFDDPARVGARAHGLACTFHRRKGRSPMACQHLQEVLRRAPQPGVLEEDE